MSPPPVPYRIVRRWWETPDTNTLRLEPVDRELPPFSPGQFAMVHCFSRGETTPRLREAEAADRWTWLIVTACTQLCLAHCLTTDLRRPWEKPAEPNKLTPARVRRGLRQLHARTLTPAAVPKPTRPGPGRPPGSKNRRPANRYDVGLLLATGEPYHRSAHHKVGTKARRAG